MSAPLSPNRSRSAAPLFAGAVLLLVCCILMNQISFHFNYGRDYLGRPVILFIWIYLIGWAGLIVALNRCKSLISKKELIFIICVGVAMRLILMPSNSILESDFYRYIWDGHVITAGYNPFDLSPDEMDLASIESDPNQVVEAEIVKARINHPWVKTIYPWSAQAAFAINAVLFKWDIHGFRYTFFIVDMLLLTLLLLILKHTRKSYAWIVLYAWNPLVIKEITNAMHLDIVCALFMGLFVFAVYKDKHRLATAAIALAVFTKITPIIVAPLYVVHLLHSRRKADALFTVVTGLVTCAAGVGLMFVNANRPLAGLQEFSTHWETNASLFPLIKHAISPAFDGNTADAVTATKYILMPLFALFLLGMTPFVKTKDGLMRCCLLAFMGIFLIAPVGNPWYLTWMLPFLVVSPYLPAVALMICTSLYYMNFHIGEYSYYFRSLQTEERNTLKLMEYIPFYLFWFWHTIYRKT